MKTTVASLLAVTFTAAAQNAPERSGRTLVLDESGDAVELKPPAAGVESREIRAVAGGKEGKIVITTEVNGKRITKVMDLRDVDGLWDKVADVRDKADKADGAKPATTQAPVTYLGVATAEVSKELAAHLPLPADTGLVIAAVEEGSPAAKAGLDENDVLTKFDDQLLIVPRQLAVLVACRNEGDSVKLTYLRKGQSAEASVVLGKHTPPARAADSLLLHLDPLDLDGGRPLVRVTKKLFHDESTAKDIRKNIDDLIKKVPDEARPKVEKTLRDVEAKLKELKDSKAKAEH